MKLLLVLVLLVAALYPNTDTTDRHLSRYQREITTDRLASRLYFFASDHFEGRETTARGQKLAAQYLASEYSQLGLAPVDGKKTDDPLSAYFQPFNVYRRTPREARLEVTIDGKSVASSVFSAEKHDDLSFFYGGALTSATGGVVFGGYGIAEGIKLTDKWLLILEEESTQFINKRSAIWKAQDMRIRGVDRTRLSLEGYTCRPCPFACDDHVYNQPGECPVCGMALVPKYSRKEAQKDSHKKAQKTQKD